MAESLFQNAIQWSCDVPMLNMWHCNALDYCTSWCRKKHPLYMHLCVCVCAHNYTLCQACCGTHRSTWKQRWPRHKEGVRGYDVYMLKVAAVFFCCCLLFVSTLFNVHIFSCALNILVTEMTSYPCRTAKPCSPACVAQIACQEWRNANRGQLHTTH